MLIFLRTRLAARDELLIIFLYFNAASISEKRSKRRAPRREAPEGVGADAGQHYDAARKYRYWGRDDGGGSLSNSADEPETTPRRRRWKMIRHAATLRLRLTPRRPAPPATVADHHLRLIMKMPPLRFLARQLYRRWQALHEVAPLIAFSGDDLLLMTLQNRRRKRRRPYAA